MNYKCVSSSVKCVMGLIEKLIVRSLPQPPSLVEHPGIQKVESLSEKLY